MKRNFLIVGVISLISLLCISLGLYIGVKHAAPAPILDKPSDLVFSQSLEESKGEFHSLNKWKGKLLLINFWAPWCAPCVEEMPSLSKLQANIKSPNIQIIGIGIDSKDNIAKFASTFEISFPLYIGNMSAIELSKNLGNTKGGLPFTVLLGKNGEVKKIYLGLLNISEVEKDLNAL